MLQRYNFLCNFANKRTKIDPKFFKNNIKEQLKLPFVKKIYISFLFFYDFFCLF